MPAQLSVGQGVLSPQLQSAIELLAQRCCAVVVGGTGGRVSASGQERRQLYTVFRSSMAMVMGPTPPAARMQTHDTNDNTTHGMQLVNATGTRVNNERGDAMLQHDLNRVSRHTGTDRHTDKLDRIC
jgi:hypothetical protein